MVEFVNEIVIIDCLKINLCLNGFEDMVYFEIYRYLKILY